MRKRYTENQLIENLPADKRAEYNDVSVELIRRLIIGVWLALALTLTAMIIGVVALQGKEGCPF